MEARDSHLGDIIGQLFWTHSSERPEPRKLRAELWLDTIDGVVDGSVQNREMRVEGTVAG